MLSSLRAYSRITSIVRRRSFAAVILQAAVLPSGPRPVVIAVCTEYRSVSGLIAVSIIATSIRRGGRSAVRVRVRTLCHCWTYASSACSHVCVPSLDQVISRNASSTSFCSIACEGVGLAFGRSGGSFPPDPPARAAMCAGVIFVDLRVLPLLVLVEFLALFLLPVFAVLCPLGLLTILPSLSAQL